MIKQFLCCLFLFFSVNSFGEEVVAISFPKEAKISVHSCSYYLKNKDEYCDDGVIELKYDIGEVLYGHYEKKDVNFIDFVHQGGFPRYLSEFPLVLFLEKLNGYYFLVAHASLVDLGDVEGICIDDLPPRLISKVKPIRIKNKLCNSIVELYEYKTELRFILSQ